MRVNGWNNGGQGYGIRVGPENRGRYFSRSWRSIEVEIGGQSHGFRLTDSFWRQCPEFRGRAVGEWLKKNGLAPWPKGAPPTLELVQIVSGQNRFRLLALRGRSIKSGK
jgi:hypothetical protein